MAYMLGIYSFTNNVEQNDKKTYIKGVYLVDVISSITKYVYF